MNWKGKDCGIIGARFAWRIFRVDQRSRIDGRRVRDAPDYLTPWLEGLPTLEFCDARSLSDGHAVEKGEPPQVASVFRCANRLRQSENNALYPMEWA